jgi:hypothetical protein
MVGTWLKFERERRWLVGDTKLPPLRAVSWPVSNRLFLAMFLGILAVVYIFVLLMDPYGVAPFSVPFERPVMTTQRQMYPQILRTGRYDSVVVGTSTVAALDPVALDRALGGRFASLAMPSATAWEQVQVIEYIRRTVAAPKTVLIDVDHVWCYRDANAFLREYDAVRDREFPSWAFDDNRLGNVLYLLNTPTVDAAVRTFGGLLGKIPEKVREDGYQMSTAEAAYDPAVAHEKIWRPEESRFAPWGHLAEIGREAMDFPALPWLDAALGALPATTRKILMFPPVHAHMLPDPGSPRAALEAECKNRVAEIARRRGAVLADWRIPSAIAAEDIHFYDPVHYRPRIADRLIDDLARIVNDGRESPDGSYRILVR